MYNNFNEYKKNRKVIDIKQITDTIINTKNTSYIIAIIIPHRNRIDHLIEFYNYFNKLSDKLFNNKIDVYVIDQNNADKFNRGFLLNLGYLIAKKHKSYDRYIFHDVDSYPDNDLFDLYMSHINLNIHFASPYLKYKYNFYTFFGGIIGFTKSDFEKINGFPNTFFGWGGEDDALLNRCTKHNINVYRPNKGSYILADHEPPQSTETNTRKQQNILNDLKSSETDGIRQLLNYFINIKKYPYEEFITTYANIDRNHTNNSESIQSYINKSIVSTDTIPKINYLIYKVDYLALHSFNFDKFLDKNFVNQQIEKRIKEFNGEKYYQHPIHKEILSYIEPIIYNDEIKTKIFDTYTKLKPYNIEQEQNQPKLNKEKNIYNIILGFFAKYPNQTRTKEDLFSTITFLFDTYNEFLYFRIRNNKIECAYHLYNLENKIDMLKNIKYINKQNKTLNLDDSLIDIMNSRNRDYYTLRKPHNLPTTNCLLGFDSYNYFEGNPTSYVKEFYEMLLFTIEHFKNIPDCDLLINRKDMQFLQSDGKYAYNHLIKNESTDLLPTNYYFLGSQSSKDINLDIPIPSADEWLDIDKLKLIQKNNKINIKWADKKPIAFFRGRGTGCGSTIENNPRYKLAHISHEWSQSTDKKNLIDAALSNFAARIKAYNQFIGLADYKKYKYLVGNFVSTEDQLKYRYIFNIEGNAQAYRYPNEFKKGSLILNVESDYHMWFEQLLINNKHIINIKKDYSNLYEQLIYLNNNEKIAYKIAKNGTKFSKRYINKKMIATYWFYYMYNINKNTL